MGLSRPAMGLKKKIKQNIVNEIYFQLKGIQYNTIQYNTQSTA
jgi:hypothetical protein